MNLLYIAYRNLLQRGVATALTMLSMALGVGLVVAVLTIYGVIDQSFQMSNSVGYNLLIGAKGGDLQLTLNSIYFLGKPVENVTYEYYLEFFPEDVRKEAYENSLARQRTTFASEVAQPQFDSAAQVALPGFTGVAQSALLKLAEDNCEARTEQTRKGKFSEFTDKCVPLCLGDYLGKFRAVATTPELFKDRVLDPRPEYFKKFTFKEGRNFEHNSKEHGYFEAILGSTTARELKLKLGDTFQINHGMPTGHEHENLFHVVGILDRSGTPSDRAAFVNIEGFLLMNDHAKPVAENETEDDKTLFDEKRTKAASAETPPAYLPLPVEEREVTSFLLRTVDPTFGDHIKKSVNKEVFARASSPIAEIEELFQTFLKPIRQVLLLLTFMICIVAGISILVSIYNSMSERKRDIAVMRALGARRVQVMSVILFESVFIAVAGAATGFVVAHLLIYLFSGPIENQSGVYIGLKLAPAIAITPKFSIWPELFIIPPLVLLAIAAGLFPAISAYRTDVSKSLQS